MFRSFLGALGRGILAIVEGIWNAILLPILHSIGHGTAEVVRRSIPWVIGLGGLWLLIVYKPDVANALLQLMIIGGLVWVGFKFVTRGHKRPERRRR